MVRTGFKVYTRHCRMCDEFYKTYCKKGDYKCYFCNTRSYKIKSKYFPDAYNKEVKIKTFIKKGEFAKVYQYLNDVNDYTTPQKIRVKLKYRNINKVQFILNYLVARKLLLKLKINHLITEYMVISKCNIAEEIAKTKEPKIKKNNNIYKKTRSGSTYNIIITYQEISNGIFGKVFEKKEIEVNDVNKTIAMEKFKKEKIEEGLEVVSIIAEYKYEE